MMLSMIDGFYKESMASNDDTPVWTTDNVLRLVKYVPLADVTGETQMLLPCCEARPECVRF